jgi:sterol desaturase/sphingolipid hydroxylase (fatty acid hydroxylase superfamily)
MLLLLSIITALLYSSLVEYSLHRFFLHKSYEQDHIKLHHRTFHGLKSYELDNVESSEILLSGKERLINGVLYLPPAGLFFLKNSKLGLVFFAVCFLCSCWGELLHLYFHKKTDLFFAKHYIFKSLKEHHRVHHYIYSSNYGIGSSFWDIIFRTKKWD